MTTQTASSTVVRPAPEKPRRSRSWLKYLSVRVPNWRDLTPEDEHELLSRHLNRVTDTCIPEEEAIRRIEAAILEEWTAADRAGERYFPHEFLYRILRSGKLEHYYQIDPKDSWLMAAAEKNLPIFVPGWEDSTSGNILSLIHI